MPGADEFIGVKGVAGVGAALLFMGAGTNGYDAFSAVMSSPWSTEKFTESAEEEAQARRYVRHAVVISGVYAGVGALLAYYSGGWKLASWPILGYFIVTAYMYWLYDQAVKNSPHGAYGG
jgi:hypothetical protein